MRVEKGRQTCGLCSSGVSCKERRPRWGEKGKGGPRSPHLGLKPQRAQVLGAPGRGSAGRQTGSRGYSGPGVRANRASGDSRGGGSGAGGLGTQSHCERPAQPSRPGDWPGSGGGGEMQRLRPRSRALLCVLPGIYWVY